VADSFYAPPRATVADVERSFAAPPRPPQVTRAVHWLWISFALGLPVAAWGVHISPLVGPGLVFSLVIQAVFDLLGVWIIVALGRGRNWARMLNAGLTSLGAVVIAAALFASDAGESAKQVENLGLAITLGMDVYAVMLTFTRPARGWYRAIKEARA